MTMGEFMITKVHAYQPPDVNQTAVTINLYITRSFWKMFSTTYLLTFCLLMLVQMTFYFPEDNFQVRATVALSCMLILATFFASTSGSLPSTTTFTYVEVWMIFAQLMTFVEIILHTVVGYIKEREKAYKLVRKVTPAKGTADFSQMIPDHPLSSQVNLICGRFFFPCTLGLCTLFYSMIAVVHYNQQAGSEDLAEMSPHCNRTM
jgi:hypothetical protein